MVSAFGRIGDATTSHAHPMPMMQDCGRSDDKFGLSFACEGRHQLVASTRKP